MARRLGRRDRGKEQRWRRMIRSWERSGLTVRDFCACEGLGEPSFYVWRRELAKRDREAAALDEGRVNGASTEAGQFLPVQVVAEAASDSDGRLVLEVQLPTGVRLQVPSGFDRQTLTDVLAALEARAC
jgi:hypothetical protein